MLCKCNRCLFDMDRKQLLLFIILFVVIARREKESDRKEKDMWGCGSMTFFNAHASIAIFFSLFSLVTS